MSKAKEKETEEKIFDAARKVFHHRGFFGARMQEIADEAKINKSMLHYYYRSKDQLFKEVFLDSFKKVFPEILKLLGSDVPLFPKIELFVNRYMEILMANPFLPGFVFHEMNNNKEHLENIIKDLNIFFPEKMREQIKEAIDKGEIRPISPENFVSNMLSLCVFPFIAKPMVFNIFKMEEKQYRDYLETRKKELPTFIINGLKKQ